MTSLLRIYRAEFRTALAVQLQYRVALAIWLIGMVLEPVIYLVVWSTVAEARGGQVGGFAPEDFAAYYIVLMMVNHATLTWVMWEYDYRVRHGSLSFYLLRPTHPIHMDFADNITYKTLTLTVMIPAAAVLALLFKPALHPEAWHIAVFIPALVLAFSVRFLLGWTVAMAAFWTTRISAINQMYFLVLLFFSGQIAPLALLPGPLRAVAHALPFRWLIAFPVEMLLGRLNVRDAIIGLGAQAAWLIVSLLLVRLAWRAGVRRYSAVGS